MRSSTSYCSKCFVALQLLMLLAACVHLISADAAAGAKPASSRSNLKKLVECRKRAALQLCGPSQFSFYMHNKVYNPVVDNKDDFNSVYGQAPNVTWPNPFSFGASSTFEDPITAGPDGTSSQRIGTAQGFWQLDGKQEFVLFHLFTANVTDGEYKGTLDIFGQLREADPVRYLSVIGGTGDFLGARGLASCRVVTIDRTPPAQWTLSFDLDLYY